MERCLLGTAIRFCPSITFSPRSNLSIAFGSSRPARLLYQSRRMLKTSAKTNVNGGAIAIAIGHSLGASGARIMTTLVNAREQRGGPRAVGHQTARDQDDQTQLPNGDGDLGVLSSASSRAIAAIRAVTPGCCCGAEARSAPAHTAQSPRGDELSSPSHCSGMRARDGRRGDLSLTEPGGRAIMAAL